MLNSKEVGLDLPKLKEVTFRGSYTEMGDKLIIIVPKNYHNDIKKMSKPIEVVVKDLDDND
ncbi:MAG: hypothetical protein E6K94_05510 [Thaumarchaeota archaeon]|nr:MAG: hypothetical protein E6K94_05510 [Nitrososphaerota archaeon]